MNLPQREVREEFRIITKSLPQPSDILCQSLITWVTGKPHLGQNPLFKHTPNSYLLLALTELIGGVVASITILQGFPQFCPLLLISCLTTLGGARIIETTINHQCAHSKFSHSKLCNRWLLEVLSTILLIQPYDGYVRDHVGSKENKYRGHHDVRVLITVADPAFKFILKQGFCPGRDKVFYWNLLIKNIASPQFHLSLLRDRLQANLATSSLYRGLMAIFWIVCCLGLVAFTHTWFVFLIAWVLPLTLLHNISALLFALTEHKWGMELDNQLPWRVAYVRRTNGRFSAEPLPQSSFTQSPSQWLLWYIKLFFIHIPIRLACWVGEGPDHDWHHRYPSSQEWPNSSYARIRDLEANCPVWQEPYTEVWGIEAALDQVFDYLSKAK